MHTFDTKKIEAINGRQAFEELVVDGVKQFEAYANSLEKRYKSKYNTILVYMEYVANGKFPPNTKFKEITLDGDAVKEFEFKNDDLRVYAIEMSNKKIVVLGGYKNKQPKDIKKFRSLKSQFLNSLK